MQIDMLIGGRNVASARRVERHDPVTGEMASAAAAATDADVRAAAEAAQTAFESWSQTGPTARRKLLLKAADIMDGKADEFTRRMIAETGATGGWAGFNVGLSANIIREAASAVTHILGQVIPSDKPGSLSMATRHPHGVCLAIAPWNAPVILGTRAVAIAIACGNTVIMKASELCPATHRLIADCFHEAGLPPGVLNFLTNDPQDAAGIVGALIAAPEVRHVNFTGSTKVGAIVARQAAALLKPSLMELGGKAPMIVLDDADLDGAVNAAIFGAFVNQGQICMSTERIIVHEAVADAFVERLAERAAALPYGDPRGHVVLGALATREAAEKMDALIADALEKGARRVAGGARDGAIMPATLLDGVAEDMRVYREESFGPVKPIIRVKDEEEAIRVANDTEYGLSSAIFSQDVRRAMRVAQRLQTGICHINGPTVADEAQMPFGGVKSSGFGRFGGLDAIDAFTVTRWITIEDPHQHYPF